MNRRSFFKKAVSGAAVLAATPAVLSTPFMAQTLESRDDYGFTAHDWQMPNQDGPGWVSYRLKMTATLPPNSAHRIRYIGSETSPEVFEPHLPTLDSKPYRTYVFGKDALVSE
jgi:hypothetical protein